MDASHAPLHTESSIIVDDNEQDRSLPGLVACSATDLHHQTFLWKAAPSAEASWMCVFVGQFLLNTYT